MFLSDSKIYVSSLGQLVGGEKFFFLFACEALLHKGSLCLKGLSLLSLRQMLHPKYVLYTQVENRPWKEG